MNRELIDCWWSISQNLTWEKQCHPYLSQSGFYYTAIEGQKNIMINIENSTEWFIFIFISYALPLTRPQKQWNYIAPMLPTSQTSSAYFSPLMASTSLSLLLCAWLVTAFSSHSIWYAKWWYNVPLHAPPHHASSLISNLWLTVACICQPAAT